jgi:nitrogen fixation protein NifB
MIPDRSNHPCFNKEAAKEHGRIHLPVAPKCNVQCNFCNRKYDCANESRPGVSSGILTPGQAVWYFGQMKEKMNISVAGIAGPGDPFTEPAPTFETMQLLREKYPELLLCVSSNGLNLLSSVPALAELNVSHVTITINAVDAEIGKDIYGWYRSGKRVYRGKEGATLMLENQLAALKSLKDHGITVKINSIVIPGVNDHHIVEIAEETAKRGADIFNCIPMIPVEGTPFGELEEPGHNTMSGIKAAAGVHLPQMKHCQRCRADAAGLLSEKDPAAWQNMLREAAGLPVYPEQKRPYLAVTSREGFLINQHLGEAEEIRIYAADDNGGSTLYETRKTPAAGSGDQRWKELAGILSDCRALLTNGVGGNPQKILAESGMKVHIVEGLLVDAVGRFFKGESMDPMSCRSKGCGVACSGDGQGCG